MAEIGRVHIVGAGGMLGAAMTYRLRQAGLPVEALDRDRFDILNHSIAHMGLANGDVVVNCAGMINRRQGMDNAEAVFLRVNALFPRLLADACALAGARLIHITTDCVYDGWTGHYDEAVPPDAIDLYGQSKALGEPRNAMLLRTSIVGPEQRHFYSLLCWVLSQSGAIDGYVNHWWNGVTTMELARLVARILLENRYVEGLFHVFGEDLTKYQLVGKIAAAYGHDVSVREHVAPIDRDHRLRTRHHGFRAWAAIRPMDRQLADCVAVSDRLGRWKTP